MKNMQLIGERLIPAVAYGDAAGLPVETWSAERIEEEFGRIGGLLATTQNPYFAGEHRPGVTSDDTELTVAVARALIDARGFSLETQAERHIEAYDAATKVVKRGRLFPRGWGGSTFRSVERMKEGADPRTTGEPGSGGNGVLMKMSPLVFWQAARGTTDEQRYSEYDALTDMTHDSSLARAATRVHGDVLHGLMSTDEDIRELVARSLSRHKHVAEDDEAQLRDPLAYILSSRGNVTKQDVLTGTDGKGFAVPQTLGMVYGAFLGGESYSERVYNAVNLGGDTDSTASIVGAMSLSADGFIRFPLDEQHIVNRDHFYGVSRALASMALGGMQSR